MASRSALGSCVVAVVTAATLLIAAPAWAQQGQGGTAQGMQMPMMQGDESGELPYDYSISVGVGRSSGATGFGAIQDQQADLATSFEIGDGTLIEVHGVKRLWWRLAGEAEFGYAAPGVDAITTNLDGSNQQRSRYNDVKENYFSVALRLDMVDAWITPFLLGGVSVVHSATDEDSSTEPAFVFGGGVEVAVHGSLFVRADVKGMRSNVDAALLTLGAFDPEGSSPVATRVLWSIGAGVRF